MKTFKVYKKGDEYRAVKVGFSVPAFIFGGFWFLYKHVYSFGFGFVASHYFYLKLRASADTLFENYTNNDIFIEVAFALILLFAGFQGNELASNHYEEENFQLIKVIQANNLKAAIALVENDNTND
jgi:hypothetical protein